MNSSISQGALCVLSIWKLMPFYSIKVFCCVFFFLIIYLKSLSLICFSLISFWKFCLSNAASLDEFSNFLTLFFLPFIISFFSHTRFWRIPLLLYSFLWNHHLCFFLNKIHWIFLSCDHSFFLTTCSCFWVCNWHSFSFFLPAWFLCFLFFLIYIYIYIYIYYM